MGLLDVAFPLASVERIEMIEGTNSSVYGNYALGGVINIVTTLRKDERSKSVHPLPAGKPTKSISSAPMRGTSSASPVKALSSARTAISPCRNWKAECRCAESLDAKATLDYQNANLKIDFSPTDRISGIRSRRLLFRGSHQCEGTHDRRHHRSIGTEQHDLEVRERRCTYSPAGRERPAGARLGKFRNVPQQ